MRLKAVMLDCFSVYSLYYLVNCKRIEGEMRYYSSFYFENYWIEVAISIMLISSSWCFYQLESIMLSYRFFCIEMSPPSFYLRYTNWLEVLLLLTFLGVFSAKSILILCPHCSFWRSFVGFGLSSVSFCEAYLGFYLSSSWIKLSNSYEPFPLPLSYKSSE